MKKFSKLITESKSDEFRQHPLMNPVDWEEKFLPLIDHIMDNYNVPSPGDPLFTKETVNSLKSFIEKVNEDYKNYFQYVAHDGSQESFMAAFNIECDWDDFSDITTILSDNCEDIEDNANWDQGAIYTYFSKFKYDDMDVFTSDIEEICEKLKMFNNLDYTIIIFFKSTRESVSLGPSLRKHTIKNNSNLFGSVISNLKNHKWLINDLEKIVLAIYNEDTLISPDKPLVPPKN